MVASRRTELLAIPIHQPYAWFYMNGHKDVENRTRKIADKWLGQRVAVFVSKKKLTKAEYEEFVRECEELKIKKYPQSLHDFEYGGVVGTFIVTKIVDDSKSKWALEGYKHFLIKSPHKMKLIPMKGQRTPWRIRLSGIDRL